MSEVKVSIPLKIFSGASELMEGEIREIRTQIPQKCASQFNLARTAQISISVCQNRETISCSGEKGFPCRSCPLFDKELALKK